jgi:hypothetical protein
MTIKSSGSSLAFSEIAAEFGSSSNKNIGAYRISKTIDSQLTNLALDNGYDGNGTIVPLMPQSGTIKFSDFYSRKLNIVVNCNATQSVQTRTRYVDGYYTVIGGFKGGPSNTNGSKVFLNVNSTLSSTKGSRDNYAINIGRSWDDGTELILYVSANGKIYGAGGDGGSSPSNPGGTGSSAVTVRYPGTVIINKGYIQAGYGGGGGGAEWSQDRQVTTTSGGKGKRSDIRLKTNIKKLDNILDKIMQL